MAPLLTSISACQKLARALSTLPAKEQIPLLRWHFCNDLYFLIWYGCQRRDLERQWLFERCREVQENPNGYLDLWAREHYKSTIITFGLTLQDVLNEPEITVGIFSHTRPNAKGFLRQIKREMEDNSLLKKVFPDILWQNPEREAPKWSEDDGLIVRRRGNPKESSIEAWGLVDGQPVGRHFQRLVYDDIVTQESVTTPDMIGKTTQAFQLSSALGCDGGKARYIGTRYHENDSYRAMIDQGVAIPRVHVATEDGEAAGRPVLLSREYLAERRVKMGPYIFSAQMLQNPTADKLQGFRRDWLKFYGSTPAEVGPGTTRYMLVDAANDKRPTNDYTAIWVVGLGSDTNFYVLDLVRDRLNLVERGAAVFRLHRKWKPYDVRYEKYGLMADTDYLRERMERENYRFTVTEVAGQSPKRDRIRRLVPGFAEGRWYFPQSIVYTDNEGKVRELVHTFVEEEYCAFPVGAHDDMLDALSRIVEPDLPLVWPSAEEPEERPKRYESRAEEYSAWAS